MFRLLATAEDPQSLADVMNRRRIELGISQTDLDHVTGMASGYCSKIFATKYNKSLGALSLPVMLGALGLKLAVVADDESLPPITRRVVAERARNARPKSVLEPRGSRADQRARRASLEAEAVA